MQKVLVPVDGSRNALHALRHVIDEFVKKPESRSTCSMSRRRSRAISRAS